ncbi:MAG: protein kinase, partial [Acidobacteriota bacterium]
GTLNNGILHFNNGKWTVYNTTTGLPQNTILNISTTTSQDGQERVLALTTNGLVSFHGGKWTAYNSMPPGDLVYTVIDTVSNDGTHKIYAGTSDGLAYFDNGKWLPINITNDQTQPAIWSAFFSNFKDGNDILWLGTNNGIVYLKNGKWIDLNAITKIPRTTVTTILETRSENGSNFLWFGTLNNGVYRVNISSGKFDYENYHEMSAPTLPSNNVSKIIEDSKKRIYLVTLKGAVRLTPRSTSDYNPEYTAFTFSTEDGLPNLELVNAFIDRNGYIWFATTKGFAMIDQDKGLDDPSTKPLLIDRVLVNGNPNILNKTALKYYENNLTFQYVLLSYFRDSDSLFKTQLIGFDPTPSEWNTKAESVYTSLPKGKYLFRVWAKDYAGNISGPVDFAFEINPSPWNTLWAYLCYSLGLIGIGYGLLQFRIKALKRQNAILESRVAKRTRELAEKNNELENKNRELAIKHEALQFSQHQAISIFSALAEALPGTVLDGKYRLEEKLGSGGFGVVFKSIHLGLIRPVAVKVFKPAPNNASVVSVARFLNEGISACRVNHPNAVSIFDSGISTQGIAYLVMELLNGHNLSEELRRNGKLSLKRCLEIILPLCDVLNEAHSSGMIHRDIKPDNIYLHYSKEG